MNKVLLKSDKMNWETPNSLFEELDAKYHFTLDPCCEITTAKCKKFYTKEDDGLTKDWDNEIVFVNPPYGKDIKLWVEKCYKESLKGVKIVMLIPARTDTKYFHEFIYNKANIVFLKGRVKFLMDGKQLNPAPFPSMLVLYNLQQKEDNNETN